MRNFRTAVESSLRQGRRRSRPGACGTPGRGTVSAPPPTSASFPAASRRFRNARRYCSAVESAADATLPGGGRAGSALWGKRASPPTPSDRRTLGEAAAPRIQRDRSNLLGRGIVRRCRGRCQTRTLYFLSRLRYRAHPASPHTPTPGGAPPASQGRGRRSCCATTSPQSVRKPERKRALSAEPVGKKPASRHGSPK
jgi:hypothetical protein